MDYAYPSLLTMPMISGRCCDAVSTAMMMKPLSSFAVPPGDVSCRRGDDLLCSCASPAFADEHLLRRSWICLRLKPQRPLKIDRPLESDKWTLEDDDEIDDSSLPDLI